MNPSNFFPASTSSPQEFNDDSDSVRTNPSDSSVDDTFDEVDLDPLPPPSPSFSTIYFKWLWWRISTAIVTWVHSTWIAEKLAVQYLYADSKKHKRGILIGIFTVFLVVTLVAVLDNNVQRSPLIFWRIAERTVGENDLLLTSGFGIAGIQSISGDTSGGITNMLVNQKYLNSRLDGVDQIEGTSGRWVLFGRILPANYSAMTQSSPSGSVANGTYVPPTPKHTAAVFLLGIDSVKESAINLGRAWTLPPLGLQELYLSRSIVREIGLDPATSVGANIILRLDLLDVAQTLNVGGISGTGTGAGAESMNVTISHTQTEAERAAEEAEEDDNTPAQNQALLLRLLIERSSPNMTQLWDQPVNFGNSTRVVIAFLEYVNTTIASRPASAAGGFTPFPFFPNWKPGDPIPDSLIPLATAIAATYGLNLSPALLQLLIERALADAQIGPAVGRFLNNTDAYNQAFDVSSLILDPSIISRNLDNIKNGTETYGQLLDLASPFILQLLRIDTPFVIKNVVDEPDGKWAEALGSIALLESASMMDLLSGSIEKILNLQSQINMSNPIVPPGTGIPSGLPGPIQPAQLNYPLETLLEIFIPSFNATLLHRALGGMDMIAKTLQNNTKVLTSVVQYTKRYTVYLKNLDDMNNDLMTFTNIVSESLGFDYALTYVLPLSVALKITIYVRYFLDNIFGSVVTLLTLLGMLLIYSLLLNDVDSKTYEYGMLRALGMKQKNLILVLMTKSVGFSVPGICLGLTAAVLANIPLAKILGDFAHLAPDYTFLPAPIITSMALGFLMPLVANIVPISRALSKTLRDSLDVYHVVVSEVTVRVIKLAELGIDLWQSALSVLMIIIGFTTFYVVPYAFTYKLIPLFLAILNAILLGMLFGLCIVAQLLQPYLEKAVLKILLTCVIRPHRKLYSIVTKNLVAHSNRNKKTSQMFLLCLSFLIFAGVMFNLQSAALGDNLKVYIGADLQIQSPLKDYTQHLKEEEMKDYLDNIVLKRQAALQGNGDDPSNYVVEGYTFVSYPINYLLPVDQVYFSSLPQFPKIRNQVWGVEENYLDVVYNRFYDVASTNTADLSSSDTPHTERGDIDVVKLLFMDKGNALLPEEKDGIRLPGNLASGPYALTFSSPTNSTTTTNSIKTSYTQYLDVIISEALNGAASIDTDTPLHLSVHSWNEDIEIQNDYLAKARGICIKLPGFLFSSYRQTASLSSVVISMDAYAKMMKDVYGSFVTPKLPPKQKLLIRLTPDTSRDQREDVINGLRTFFKSDKTEAVDTASLIATMDQAIALMNLFFTLVGTIAMIMCFFILWLSFTANVQENAWEFGVLRAIGLNSVEVVMIYIYEALALVIASVLLGTIIGMTIAATLTLQFNLFTELPFHMEFPLSLFLTMLFMAFIVATAGSGLPAYSFLSKSISNVLRRQ